MARKCSIKDFITENSLIFKTGRGFYEFTKPEKISNKKEVVFVDKETGDMFSGQEAFDMIGGEKSDMITIPILLLSGREREAALADWSVRAEHQLQQGPGG